MTVRTALTVHDIVRTGTGLAIPSETAGDVSNGNSAANDGRVLILAHNTNGASTARTLTVAFPKTVDGQSVASRTYSIAAAASKYIGPFPVSDYGSSLLLNASHAEMHVTVLRVP